MGPSPMLRATIHRETLCHNPDDRNWLWLSHLTITRLMCPARGVYQKTLNPASFFRTSVLATFNALFYVTLEQLQHTLVFLGNVFVSLTYHQRGKAQSCPFVRLSLRPRPPTAPLAYILKHGKATPGEIKISCKIEI